MVQTVWLGMCITHPSDWEPVQLGLDAAHGQCILVDRTSQRLDVHWRPSKAAPDLQRMFAQYSKSVRKAQLEVLVGAGGWEGFVRRDGAHPVTQAGKYFSLPAGRVVEAVIVWPGPRDKALERKLLAGLAPDPPSAERRIWQALGLSVSVPTALSMKKYVAQPGQIRFDFVGEGGLLSVSRVALVDQWLTGPLDDWLDERTGEGSRRSDGGVCTVNAHPGSDLLSSTPGKGFRRLAGHRRWRYQKAWLCPQNERLHLIEWSHRGADPRPAPEVEIGCCRALREVGRQGG